MKLIQSKHLIWIILTAIAGIALRTVNYAGASSMWYDELTAALNVSERSYYQLLTQPLDYNQVASIGFLLTLNSLHLFLVSMILHFDSGPGFVQHWHCISFIK